MNGLGRYWALATLCCPKHNFNIGCPDCPDSCPLDIKKEFVNGYVTGRNNPERHPEDFIDEFASIYPDDIYELDYSVNGEPIINGEKTYGYYFKKEPEHWKEFVNKVYKVIELRCIKNNA